MAALEESLETSFQKVKHLNQITNKEEYDNYMDFLDAVEAALPGDAYKFAQVKHGFQLTREMYNFLNSKTIRSGNYFGQSKNRDLSKMAGDKLKHIKAINFGELGIKGYPPKETVFDMIYNRYKLVLLSDGREVHPDELRPYGGKTRRRRKHSRKSKRQRS